MYISETLGWICSTIGIILGWVYLELFNDKDIILNLKFSSFYIVIGITLCIIGFGLLSIIAAMEKWNKYQEKRNIKKIKKFESDNK